MSINSGIKWIFLNILYFDGYKLCSCVLFEIKEIYKGDKYDDTAITGIIMDFYTPNH